MILEDATQDDVNALNAVAGYPRVGIFRGRPVKVPPDWRERVAKGERIRGVSAYYLQDELEEVGQDADGVPIMAQTGRKVVQVRDSDAQRFQALDAAKLTAARQKLKARGLRLDVGRRT